MIDYIIFWIKHLKCLTLFSLIGLAIVTLFFDKRNKLINEGYFDKVTMDCKVLEIEDEIDCNDRAFVYFLVDSTVVCKKLNKKDFLLFQEMTKDKGNNTIIQYKFSKEDINPNGLYNILFPLVIIISLATIIIIIFNILESYDFWNDYVLIYKLDESYVLVTVLLFPSLLLLTIIFCLLFGIG